MTCQIRSFFTFRVLIIVTELEKKSKIFHCCRKHLFVLHQAKFDGNSSQNDKVAAIYTLRTLNVLDLIFNVVSMF